MKRNLLGQFTRRTNGTLFEGFGVYLDSKGYPCIWIANRSLRVHVWLWEREHGPKPKGYVLHHRDFNKAHYSPDNLELLTESDHRRIHAGWIRENGEWVTKPCTRCAQVLPLSAFYPRKGFTPTALCKPCTNIVTAARNKTIPEKRRLYNQRWYTRRRGVRNHAKE